MLSRKEEERNEKIIRGLMKLPPNRRCINCNSLGPQYVCTNFWTFVCTTCSGIHREFTHRVKSVSMAKFTSQEVEVLQRGGNQRAREMLLKDWDLQRQRLPDSSNVDRVREFIKTVYVDKKYAGGKVPDKPPRDVQSLRNHQDDTRRASSFHSFSQSPPYEYQYEDRKYGKQAGVLSRKPGSDRGSSYEGKISSFVYSPGRLGEQMYEDRFANEGSASRVSDYSVYSPGDPFGSATQSPNFQGKLSSPPMLPVRDILVEDARRQTTSPPMLPHTQRNKSSGSFGSFDSSSVSLNSVNAGSLLDVVSEPEQPARTRPNGTVPVPQSSISANAVGPDFFSLASSAPCVDLFDRPEISSTPSMDLFTGIADQHLAATFLEQKTSTLSFPKNEGWATFDLPQHEAPVSQIKNGPQAGVPQSDLNSLANASLQSSSVSYTSHLPFTSLHNQLHGPQASVSQSDLNSLTNASMQSPSSWNAFGDTPGSLSQASYENVPYMSKPECKHPSNAVQKSLPTTDHYLSSKLSEGGMSSLATVGKSTNPFDFPYDSELDPGSMFLNMNSLQSALPDSQLAPAYVGGLAQPWFPPNTVTQSGGLGFMAGEAPTPQLPNMATQGPVASLGGNPFA